MDIYCAFCSILVYKCIAHIINQAYIYTHKTELSLKAPSALSIIVSNHYHLPSLALIIVIKKSYTVGLGRGDEFYLLAELSFPSEIVLTKM